MSEFDNKSNSEGFEEVPMSRSSDVEEAIPVEAVNVSKLDDESNVQQGVTSHDITQSSGGWGVLSNMWEKAKQVTADTVEATGPARSQLYDLSLKVAADIGPATQVMTDVAGSTFTVVSEAFVSTSAIVSTSLNNATHELGEFAAEMKRGPPPPEAAAGAGQSSPQSPKPTNTNV